MENGTNGLWGRHRFLYQHGGFPLVMCRKKEHVTDPAGCNQLLRLQKLSRNLPLALIEDEITCHESCMWRPSQATINAQELEVLT